MNPVLFISVDCLRADHLGCYGYDRPTSPNIDSFADTATVFEHAYSNCPGTRWAFQSLHTGVSTLQIDGLGIPEEYCPLASYFSDHGYATGGFAVNGFVSRDYRYDTGFDTYYSVQDSSDQHGLLGRAGQAINDTLNSDLVLEKVLRPVREKLRSSQTGKGNRFQPSHSDRDTVDQALSFVDDHQNEAYFLWVHLMDAHTPYGYWPDHLEALRGDADIEHTIHPGQEELIEQGEEPPQNVIDTYDAGVRSTDEQIGRLLNVIPDNATVVLTGDHGEEFGRFGDFHDASLYGSMTQVPIIIRTPGIEIGRSQTPAQHLDIPPALLHAANIEAPEAWEGEPLQISERTVDEPIYHTLGKDKIAVREGDWKYIESEGSGELYRAPHSEIEEEPADDPDQRDKLRTLANEYRASAGSAGAGASELGEGDLSDEVEGNLEDLGYL
ncbi:sulfatase [Saliphagus sp. LR7]|uniref:sulfatase n=1 Tax=Saliphagus sp. LR7 TaxID=2282654 RepID=UPI000DF801CA|nr:sulfatase [Saliphagus sp. LR7]